MKKNYLGLSIVVATVLALGSQAALAETVKKSTPSPVAACAKDANANAENAMKDALAAYKAAMKKVEQDFAAAKKAIASIKETSLKICKMPKPAATDAPKPTEPVKKAEEKAPAPATPTSTTAPAPAPEGATIIIKEFAFTPGRVTIKKGATVTWNNQDIVSHSVESDANDWKSDLFAKGQSFSHTFNSLGVYSYHCGPHQYMTGEVVVTN